MTDEPNTHLDIDHNLCGEPVSIEDGEASVRFETTERMGVDARGLVHGGFVFGLADHAAMLAVNDPHVVLVSADVDFTAPVTVGDEVEARASVVESNGPRYTIEARASVLGEAGDEVFRGTFEAVVTEEHILDDS